MSIVAVIFVLNLTIYYPAGAKAVTLAIWKREVSGLLIKSMQTFFSVGLDPVGISLPH